MTTPQQSTARRVLSVIGLLALIVLVAWLAISFVRIMPGAIASLASLADSVYHPEQQTPELNVSTQSNIINVSEDVIITWDQTERAGDYTFSYDCNDSGVALNIELRDNNIAALECDTPFAANDISSLVLTAESNKKRFVDIVYSLTFTPEDSGQDAVTETKRLTIVNPNISTSVATSTEEEQEEEPEETVTPTPTTPSTPSQPTGQTNTVSQVIYALPQSDPNGYVDLQARHVGVGELTNNTFIPRGEVATDMQGAFQFAVKNIGTKTASNWSYEATLPNGSTYESGSQVALRPNEEAIITLGFTTYGETGIQTIGAEVSAVGDTRSNNNRYSWVMTIVK